MRRCSMGNNWRCYNFSSYHKHVKFKLPVVDDLIINVDTFPIKKVLRC